MEIREITQYDERLPFIGYGIWVIFEMRHRKVHAIHPIRFCEIILSEYDFVKSAGKSLWPNNTTKSSFDFERWRNTFKERVKFFVEHRRPFPISTIARIISEIDEITVEEATRWIVSLNTDSAPRALSKESIEYQLRKGVDISSVRGIPISIVNALNENGAASINRITTLVEDKLKTKSGLGRVVTYFVHKLTAQGILEIVA